jgi:predicted DsbA family dithiol-disulfide isomerase
MLVEIWSDVACPWCYVGKRRFEQALAGFEHRDDVQVMWRSFELDPSAPAAVEGDRAARIAAKYGTTVEQAREMEQRMVDTAAAEGLAFRFEIARSGTTFDAHRIVHLAAEHGLGDAMKERLLRAYFTEGELMSDHETLVRLAGEVGLEEEDVRAALGGERYAAESATTSRRRLPSGSPRSRRSSSTGRSASPARSPRPSCSPFYNRDGTPTAAASRCSPSVTPARPTAASRG